MGALVVATLCLHLAAYAWVARKEAEALTSKGRAGADTHASVQIRLMQRPVIAETVMQPDALATVAPEAASDETPKMLARDERVAEAPAPDDLKTAAPLEATASSKPEVDVSEIVSLEPEQLAVAPAAGASAPPVDHQQKADPLGSDDDYLPRPVLTVAPQPRAAVPLVVEPGALPPGRIQAVLVLFIDEQGVVRRVRQEGNDLPPELEALARDGFMQAGFQPGELNGQAVKSRIRIEIVFESTETHADRTARSARPML